MFFRKYLTSTSIWVEWLWLFNIEKAKQDYKINQNVKNKTTMLKCESHSSKQKSVYQRCHCDLKFKTHIGGIIANFVIICQQFNLKLC